MNIQFKKGVLDLCVLSFLKEEDMYGYEISETISRHLEISDGTVYPILRKLKAEGFLTTYLSEESGGPPRKYYSLTTKGRDMFKAEAQDWIDFAEKINKILKGERK